MSALPVAFLNKLVAGSSVRFPTTCCRSQDRKAHRVFALCSRQQQLSRRSLLLTGICGSPFCRGSSVRAASSMAESQKKEEEQQPENFRYVQLWVSEDGESHIKECKMSGFKTQAYSSMPQFVKDEFGGQPEKIIFTELSVGLEQPLHPCPQVQFVVTLSGSWNIKPNSSGGSWADQLKQLFTMQNSKWYIKTTDGAKYVFKAGEVLFQDNTKTSPAKKLGQHLSGAVGDVPCQQFIAQFNRKPEVDNPNPF